MEVKLLNGEMANIKFRNKRLRPKSSSKSLFQYEVGQRLSEQFPHDIIFEEVYIPVEKFILDFFIPSISLVIECHGRQHKEHIKHFHRTKKDFNRQKDTDQRKRDWCKLNGFKLIEIYDE